MATGKRAFLGRHLDDTGRDGLLFGSPQRIVDGVGKVLEQTHADEIIFCGMTANAEAYQRFDEDVLAALTPTAVAV